MAKSITVASTDFMKLVRTSKGYIAKDGYLAPDGRKYWTQREVDVVGARRYLEQLEEYAQDDKVVVERDKLEVMRLLANH